MLSRYRVFLLFVLVLLASSPAHALLQFQAGAVALPTTGRPTSLAAAADGTFLVGTVGRTRSDELFAIDPGPDGRTPTVAWSLDLGVRVNGIAVDGTHAYLATADDAAELMVVDLTLRQRVASFDVPGTADGWSVTIAEPGVVDLVVRRSAGPERYRLSVATDPISVLSTAEDPTAGKPTRPEGLRRYRIRGRLVARERRVIPGGALHYVLSTDRRAQFQVVEEVAPVGFADLDGDGVYRLGCVGDSNTSLVSGLKKWCEIIRDGFSDPDFAVINVAVNGATVNPNLRFTSDATMQMAEVLSQAPDLLVLAFGTHDVFQGRTPQQIHDAYLAQQPTADAAGVPFYVATTPPIIGCPNCTPGIEQGNDMLRATFAGRVVEFYTGFGADEFNPDHYHLNSVGQQLRAERALEVLGR